MASLAIYMLQFAELLGLENEPVLADIVDASTGIAARVRPSREAATWKRVATARRPGRSRPASALKRIEDQLAEDGYRSAEVRDKRGNVLYLVHPTPPPEEMSYSIVQRGQVDGVVTGLVGADDTMHLYLRDPMDRKLSLLVKDEALARELLANFRGDTIRVTVEGSWCRTASGWVPETSKCLVESFMVLEEEPLALLFEKLRNIEGNGWRELDDPQAAWRDLRGIN